MTNKNKLQNMNDSQLQKHHTVLAAQYAQVQEKQLKLDMSRGKPCVEQLNLSNGLLTCLTQQDYKTAAGTDCRNYGVLDGIPEIKELFANIFATTPAEVIIGGNSSLTLMHDLLVRAMLHGLHGSPEPWCKLPKIKFICPSPGYDRHFAISAHLGMELITVDYHSDGPDMTEIEKLVAADPAIKGIWCVPKYSNPTGLTYSEAIVKRLAAMPTAAPDFRIFWDNAYAVHHLNANHDPLADILTACKQAGQADKVFLFASTSKITFPGAGVAALAASETNINWLKKQMNIQTIGHDKINQLRHIRFFGNLAGLTTHMQKHAAILQPKFAAVQNILTAKLGQTGLASWSKPNGGYFISLDTLPGCARKVVAKAAAAGVILTGAGATFPHGKDPADKNIRLAPTFPPLAELEQAMDLVCLCVDLVSTEQELAARGL